MDRVPGFYPVLVFLPRLFRLVLKERGYAWSGRQRLFADTKSFYWRRIVRGERAKGSRAGQQSQNARPDNSANLLLAYSFAIAPKCAVSHCLLTVSEPMPYQPSSCRPSLAKRIAGCRVLGSSMAMRKS